MNNPILEAGKIAARTAIELENLEQYTISEQIELHNRMHEIIGIMNTEMPFRDTQATTIKHLANSVIQMPTIMTKRQFIHMIIGYTHDELKEAGVA